ncbi:hypothetical protein C9374_000455 [Naegleria lovaniensis]|uniref:Uncharacterized protein n=1 Tax=Naegleria lovaniensis TaxID=51637 RepID=A0AA88GTU2_NAELO|nr:uncharacterized protein C9374_000455 [Naegleria lovaniensis]KAG2388291.1 hypothetical protein C9374_000455 [Naegleria lovaniensis]
MLKTKAHVEVVSHRNDTRPAIHVAIMTENTEHSRSTPFLTHTTCPQQLQQPLQQQQHSPFVIHIHAFVNDQSSENEVRTRISRCEHDIHLHFYETKSLDVSMSTTHYSGSSASKKLKFVEFFYGTLEHVILMDTDVLPLFGFDDLFDLWSEFNKFNSSQMLGIAQEQSDFYGTKTAYNSGIMLLSIKKLMEQGNWVQKMREETLSSSPNPNADQDVIIRLLEKNSSWKYELECGWNFQFIGFVSRGFNCQTCIRIAHFNTCNARGRPEFEVYKNMTIAHNQRVCDSRKVLSQQTRKSFATLGNYCLGV